ncbi:classical SDR family protein [Candidatus Nanopelagicus abundans]|jgi:NAD(P)-dependent dehydrogenase (short-subunit alcohol dehydrogenase family)|uniref:Classical SDR family protein n=1 Tax=Candidatus Nanopelagicus abundans TaxID=1884916 RepID=A0A249L5X0_9ACTN|nr:SDR family NAD(P)-dependent oxidoreductase [Candidatus Nanopelagicus abundans]ASY24452.1 classical SDR family protein [Candidatus Nanopelagicus abundans]
MSDEKKWAIVTGGSRGLGFETAKGLIAAGISVYIIGKDEVRAQQSAEKLGCNFRAVDVADSKKFRQVLTEINEEATSNGFQTLDILVLAHGVMSEKMSKTLRTTDEEWRRTLSINLDAVFTAVNQLAPAMSDARKGRVIVYSACLGRMSGPGTHGGLAPYRISKAGVNAFVKNLSYETGLGARGFLVDAICPNHCRTDMGGPDAPRSAQEGADTAIWLATREFDPAKDKTGLLWEDRQVVDW